MMLAVIAAMEAVHAHAYSLLMDTVGMPEVEYQAFKQYAQMAAKHDYVSSFDVQNERDVAKALAVFSAFTEGLQLFPTFAILMNFARGDLPSGARMKGMTQIVTWSIRDESLHVESMMRLFHAYVQERPHIWDETLKAEISPPFRLPQSGQTGRGGQQTGERRHWPGRAIHRSRQIWMTPYQSPA